MTASALQLLGMLVACGGAAVSLARAGPADSLRSCGRGADRGAGSGGGGRLALDSASSTCGTIPRSCAVILAVVVIAVGVGAAIFRRFRWAFPVSVFAVLPLRVPVHLGGQTSHLLVPLYLVIAAALVSFAYRRWPASGPRPTTAARARKPRREALPTGRRSSGFTACSQRRWLLYAIQTAYSADVSNAIENAAFFLVPFAVMLMLLGEVRWTAAASWAGC